MIWIIISFPQIERYRVAKTGPFHKIRLLYVFCDQFMRINVVTKIKTQVSQYLNSIIKVPFIKGVVVCLNACQFASNNFSSNATAIREDVALVQVIKKKKKNNKSKKQNNNNKKKNKSKNKPRTKTISQKTFCMRRVSCDTPLAAIKCFNMTKITSFLLKPV